MTPENEALYRAWQRKRKGEGHAELPRHRQALASLEAHAGGAALTAVTRDVIQTWAGEAMEWMAESSRASYWSSARAFYNWCASDEEEIIARSPMRGLHEPKVSKSAVPVPEEAAVRKVIAAADRDRTPKGRRDSALLRVLADTGGPRASELAGLWIAGRTGAPRNLGVDLARDTVTVRGKGGKVRTWPVAAKTAAAAERWLRVRDGLPAAKGSALLWVGFRQGAGRGPLTRTGVGRILAARCEEAGVAHMHPHEWRHFSYHHFLKRGGRLNDAMLLYGWEDDQMPRRYAASLAEERSIEAGAALAIGDQW